MTYINILYIAIFFLSAGICLIFAAAWIVNSESKRHIMENELAKLKARTEEYERDKFMMTEKISELEETLEQVGDEEFRRMTAEGREKITRLEGQNTKLEEELEAVKKKLKDASSSLEDVYKALC